MVFEELQQLNDLPPEISAQIQPAIAELLATPTPPRSKPADLPSLLDDVAATSLLIIDHATDLVFVHRWTASELERRWHRQGHDDQLRLAHAQAAEYWLWRIEVWPQDRDADIHDMLEARRHLLAADETDKAGHITERACARLEVIGAWDHETALIHDALARRPDSPRRAAWLHQLGNLALLQGDHVEAERRYQQSLTISEELGDRAGAAGI
jgi:Tetratricopeptide repeat